MQFGITKNQAIKILKTALYIAASAVLGYLITLTTKDPHAFGEYTIIINLALVTLKQFVSEDK